MSLFNSIIPFKKGSRPRVPCPRSPLDQNKRHYPASLVETYFCLKVVQIDKDQAYRTD